MAGVGVKILKPGGAKMDKFEESVSQVHSSRVLSIATWSVHHIYLGIQSMWCALFEIIPPTPHTGTCGVRI